MPIDAPLRRIGAFWVAFVIPLALLSTVLWMPSPSSVGVTGQAAPFSPISPQIALSPPVRASNSSYIGNWTEQTDYGVSSGTPGVGGLPILGNACVTNSTYLYCVGGQNVATGQDLSDAFFANLSASESLSGWTETTDYGAASGSSGTGGVGIEFASCVAYSWDIYCVGGATSGSPFILSDVFYAPLSPLGIGPWHETTDYAAASGSNGTGGTAAFQLKCITSITDIYCTGGTGSKSYFAGLTASGVGAWAETTDYGATSGSTGAGGIQITDEACVTNSSYVYCLGGISAGFRPVSTAVFAPLGASGGIGAWSFTTDYGATSGTNNSTGIPIYGTSCVLAYWTMVCVDGATNGNVVTDYVYYSNVSDTGLGPWTLAGPYGDAVLRGYQDECGFMQVDPELATSPGAISCVGMGFGLVYAAPVGADHNPTSLQTTLSASTVVGGTGFSDSAVLSGATPNAGGRVIYEFFPNGGCNPPAKGSDDVIVQNAAVPNSRTFTAMGSAASPYNSILATYSGDAHNAPAVSLCENINVTLAKPLLYTDLSADTVNPGATFTDSATLSFASPIASGAVRYMLYPNGDCANASTGSDIESVTNGAVGMSTAFTATATPSGSMSILATYGGDANDNPASSGCEEIMVNASSSAHSGPNPTGPAFLGLPQWEGLTILGGVIGAIILVAAALLLRSRMKGGSPPNPPTVSPPSPTPPPPAGPPPP